MHRFCDKFFKIVKFCAILIFSACFIGSAKSYSLVDADKVVELLSVAADTDFCPATGFLNGVDTTPITHLSVSPFISESPDLTADSPPIYTALSTSEKKFLLPICRNYEAFLRKFKEIYFIQNPFFRNAQILKYFKYAVLVRLFESAVKMVKLENVNEYRKTWWYGVIFSCTDEEMYHYDMLYPVFEQYKFFDSLGLANC